MMLNFKVGEVVHWQQNLNDKRSFRTGNIVAIIPVGMSTVEAVGKWRAEHRCGLENLTHKATRLESEQAYLVLVVHRDPTQKPSLYCPVPSRLTRKWISAKRYSFTKRGVEHYCIT